MTVEDFLVAEAILAAAARKAIDMELRGRANPWEASAMYFGIAMAMGGVAVVFMGHSVERLATR